MGKALATQTYQNQSTSRIEGLDSMRGIAALIVVFTHFKTIGFDTFHETFWVQFTPVQWLICGRLAVILFFVLSGFVLAAPIIAGRSQQYTDFLIRRFARIYLPFLFSVLVAGGLWWVVTTIYPARHFQWNEWIHDISFNSFLSHILATGLMGSHQLNPPVWTLVFELRVAIIFPVLVWLVYKKPFLSVIASFVLAYIASKFFKQIEPESNMYFAETVSGSLLLTVYYIQYFVFGIFIAVKMDWIKSVMFRVPEKIHYAMIGLMFLIPAAVFGKFIIHEMWYAAMAVYLVVCCIIYAKMNHVLMAAPLQWLGKVSFSLYLIHMPIIFTLMYIFFDHLPIWAILALSFPLTLVASELMNRYIEIPSMQLGKKWTRPKA